MTTNSSQNMNDEKKYTVIIPFIGHPSMTFLADNCMLYREINTLNDCQDLQKDINTLCNWESKWQMKFNIDKCYIVQVTHKGNALLMTYNMNGRPIEVTASHT